MEPLYVKLPIPNAAFHIRLLDLLPGVGAEPLIGRLRVQRVTVFTRYEALSYTWGVCTPAQTIIVNGHAHDTTPNLHSALLQLRHRNKRRKLWIDAICIDQSDLEERSEQVMKMGDIYRNAEQVLIWLGDETRDTDVAFRHMYQLLDLIPQWPDLWKPYREDEIGTALMTGLCEIKCYSWWERIWVVQEVATASGDPMIMCGNASISWSKLMYLLRHAKLPNLEREEMRILESIRHDVRCPPRLRGTGEAFFYNSETMAVSDVLDWISRTMNFQSTDPRDKVYGLLGLARDPYWKQLRPDYIYCAHA
jgi:hypothetical protein